MEDNADGSAGGVVERTRTVRGGNTGNGAVIRSQKSSLRSVLTLEMLLATTTDTSNESVRVV